MANSTLMAWNNTQQFEARHQRGSADGNALEAGSILEEVKGSAGLQSVPKKMLLELDSGKLSPKTLSLKNTEGAVVLMQTYFSPPVDI